MTADLILIIGRFSTLDRANPNAEAVAIAKTGSFWLWVPSKTRGPTRDLKL